MSVNQEERAFRAWGVLIERAAKRSNITYGDLAKELGIHHRPVRFVLGVIQEYCLSEGHPPLTILVVNQKNILGQGFIALDRGEIEKGIDRVFSYDWQSLPNPFAYAADGANSLQSLATAVIQDNKRATEIYAMVKIRGICQRLFRDALLRVYDAKCAICGLGFPELLEAAHIVPWNECEDRHKVNVRNGLLLCANHHKLFDAGLIAINKDFIVEYIDPQMLDGVYSEVDHSVSVTVHGKMIRMPNDTQHYPDPVLLELRIAPNKKAI